MSDHEHFRELSALAAIGQLSSGEDRELNEHLKECSSCREAHCDYARVIQHQLPLADSIRWRVKSGISRPAPDAEIRDRFLARVRAEGFELSPDAEKPDRLKSTPSWRVSHWRPALGLAVIAAVVSLGTWARREYRLVPRFPAANHGSTQFVGENENLHAQLATLRRTIDLESTELDRIKHDGSVSAESLQDYRRQLEQARAEAEQLSGQLQRAESANADATKANQQKDTVIADLHAQNEKLQRENADNLGSMVVQEARVRSLSEALERETANLERDRQLMAVGKDVRQLMGARNLHIIDVHDVDGGGKSAKAFGRVFYAEGQSLIFYAFDLPSGKLSPAKYTFQAWGQREYVSHSVRNLGTFEVDDHEQRRWVLKVNNPALLQGIDSVFVTAESLGDAKEPRGNKLLYAYIVGQPNHP
jgi:hypothetical protein